MVRQAGRRGDELLHFNFQELTDGGEESRCGWLKDKYGLSWQIIPSVLTEMLRDKDRAKSSRVMKAMLGMSKIQIDDLKRAYDGE
jgi:predicted 3-demethylubiquinone-9 3-methyltransferase (glyoxalase superfamily)